MTTAAVLPATVKIRLGMEKDFQTWQVRHHEMISQFPGFLSSDIMPPGSAGGGEWTIVLNFQTHDAYGPLGAKPMGNALADATGVRFTSLPVSADRIFEKISQY